MSGCMNACGHHHVGHIGILGVDKHGEEWYQITLGGSVNGFTALGDVIGPSVAQKRRRAHHRSASSMSIARGAKTASASSRPIAASACKPFKEQRVCARILRRREIVADDWVTSGRGAARPTTRRRDRAVREVPREPRHVARAQGPARRALAPADEVEDLAADLPRLALVALRIHRPRRGPRLHAGEAAARAIPVHG